MNRSDNSQRTGMLVWLLLSLACALAAAAPFIFDIDMDAGGGAMLVFGLVFAVVALIMALVFRTRARLVERISSDGQLLAHWTYGGDEWKSFLESEFETRRKEANRYLILLAVMIAIILIITRALPCFKPSVGLVTIGALALLGFIIWLIPRIRRRKLEATQGEVHIMKDAVLLAGRLHNWNSWDWKLEHVEIDEAERRLLVFYYSYPLRRRREYYQLKVPIPSGGMRTAEKIVDFFANPTAEQPHGVGAIASDGLPATSREGSGRLKPEDEQKAEARRRTPRRIMIIAGVLLAAAVIAPGVYQIVLYFDVKSRLDLVIDGHSEGIGEVIVSDEGRLIAASSARTASVSDRTVRITRSSDGTLLRTFDGDEPVAASAFSGGGRRLAVGRRSDVAVHDVASGNVIRRLPIQNPGALKRLRFSNDGSMLAGWGDCVCLWDCSTGACIRHETGGESWSFGDAAFTSTGVLVIAEYNGDSLRVRDFSSGVARWSVLAGSQDRASEIHSMALTLDGSRLAAQLPNCIALFDALSGSIVKRIDARADTYTKLEFSDDGSHIGRKLVMDEFKVWNVRSGALVLSLPADDDPIPAMSRDGRYCAALFQGGIVNVYDLATGEVIETFRHRKGIIDPSSDAELVTFMPDGKRVISAGKRMHVWRIQE